MKKQVFNPYLPADEYVPDGEPHVFGDRIYLFGSHDKSHGLLYCPLDYVCWSAPVSDLSDWTCSGVIYRKEQDPHYKPLRYQYAPDVVQGADGRFYLFYELAFVPIISVAVCDTPDGKYEYLGDVALRTDAEEYTPFDPGVMRDEDGKIWLYFGSCFEKDVKKLGAMCVQLKEDMLTPVSEPVCIVPSVAHARGTGFEGHEFFEASSMRKFDGKYYFIYSSILSHELCYAVSDYPNRNFVYGGILYSNADIGLYGRKQEDAVTYWANNHGSIEKIGGKYYIFGHRHTQRSQFSRQGIAEEITLDEDGHFRQAELTSCGLSGKPLSTKEHYPAYIACNLIGADGGHLRSFIPGLKKKEPRVNQKSREVYISHFSDGSIAGYKYFAMTGEEKRLILMIKGTFAGKLYAELKEEKRSGIAIKNYLTREQFAEIAPCKDWRAVSVPVSGNGKKALYLHAEGKGMLDIKEFWFES